MKAQSEPLGYLLIIALSIFLISSALYWGVPWIQKNIDNQKILKYYDECCNSLNSKSLPNILKDVIFQKTEKVYYTSIDGTWNIYDNSITLKFFSKAEFFNPQDKWIFIDGCNKDICNFGLDPFYSIYAMSKKLGDVYEIIFNITLKKIKYENNIFEIKLLSEKTTYSNVRNLILRFEYSCPENNLCVKVL